jgi:hypothetical protein
MVVNLFLLPQNNPPRYPTGRAFLFNAYTKDGQSSPIQQQLNTIQQVPYHTAGITFAGTITCRSKTTKSRYMIALHTFHTHQLEK